MKGPGYIAIDRRIFKHPALRKPERMVAWTWMLAQAAWKPEGQTGSWGTVHVERGELATSTWILANEWGWPQTNVRCFIERLKRDGMITVTQTRSATRSATRPYLEHEISVIAISNYDKFQGSSTGGQPKPAQQPAQQPAHGSEQTQMFPGFCEPLTTQPSNQESKDKGGGVDEREARRSPSAPRHGATSTKHKTVYIHHGTEDWRIHAADYREVIGAEPLPDRHGGFWFYSLGEAVRPAHQRTWRNQAAFGAASRQGGRR